eukprot:7387866-Prymnesium_polylepis.1
MSDLTRTRCLDAMLDAILDAMLDAALDATLDATSTPRRQGFVLDASSLCARASEPSPDMSSPLLGRWCTRSGVGPRGAVYSQFRALTNRDINKRN